MRSPDAEYMRFGRASYALLALTACFAAPSAFAELPETIARIKPSVVLVGSFSPLDSPRFTFRGTGFAVGTGHWILTNAHVLPEGVGGDAGRQIAVQVWSTPAQWSLRVAKLELLDKRSDLALLSFEGAALIPLALSTSAPKEGASVAFMGFPIGGALGFSHVTHRGIISSVAALALPSPNAEYLSEKAVQRLRAGNFTIYQLDATAYPGNSGGPVFDPDSGLVIGVINSVLVKSARESILSRPSGISYVIPIENAKSMLEQ
jgi:S1-C subfamily serine protease